MAQVEEEAGAQGVFAQTFCLNVRRHERQLYRCASVVVVLRQIGRGACARYTHDCIRIAG